MAEENFDDMTEEELAKFIDENQEPKDEDNQLPADTESSEETETKDEAVSVSDIAFASATSATVGAVVILGISKDIPEFGSVPFEIASIIPLSAFAIPLISSVDCGVGIKAALLPVVSAAITY